MKRVLILTRTISRGGVPNALVSFLQKTDISQCDITIGIEIDCQDLLPYLKPEIKVIPYNEYHKTRFYLFLIKTRDKISKSKFFFILWKFLNLIEKIHARLNIKRLFKGRYDSVIAFHQGNATKYASKLIKADKRVYFYHAERIMPDCKEKYFINADHIVCASLGTMNLLKTTWKKIPSSKYCLCHYVLDYMTFRKKASEPISLFDKNQFNILTVGRLVDDKGYDLLINTAAKLLNNGTIFRWYVLGDGPLYTSLKDLISAHSLDDNVFLVGEVNNPYKYIKNSSIVVSTSRNEAYGLVIAESQVLNKTVVATKTSCALEQINDSINGYLVDFDSDKLAEKIMLLIKNQELITKIENQLYDVDYDEINAERIKQFELLTSIK